MKRIEKTAREQIEKEINHVADSVDALTKNSELFDTILNSNKFGITLTYMYVNKEFHVPVSILGLFDKKVFREAVIGCLLDEYVSKIITSLLEK